MTPKLDIHYLDESQPHQLFVHLWGRTRPQNAHVILDLRDRILTAGAETDEEEPLEVRQGQVIRYPIPALMAAAANRVMRKIAPLAQRVLDRAEVAEDSCHLVSRLDAEAEAAAEGVKGLLERGDAELWDAQTDVCWAARDRLWRWCDQVQATSTGAEIEHLVDELIARLAGEDPTAVIERDEAIGALLEHRDHLRQPLCYDTASRRGWVVWDGQHWIVVNGDLILGTFTSQTEAEAYAREPMGESVHRLEVGNEVISRNGTILCHGCSMPEFSCPFSGDKTSGIVVSVSRDGRRVSVSVGSGDCVSLCSLEELEPCERSEADGEPKQSLGELIDPARTSRGRYLMGGNIPGHSHQVAMLGHWLAERLELPSGRAKEVQTAGLLHDIGKIAIPDGILQAPRPLTAGEWEIVRTHPRVGHQLIANLPQSDVYALVALQHHERLDGSGYPAGLKNDEICLEARIVALAEVVAAMSRDMPWRPARSQEAVVAELDAGRGTLYDPAVVDACLDLIREDGENFWNKLAGGRI